MALFEKLDIKIKFKAFGKRTIGRRKMREEKDEGEEEN